MKQTARKRTGRAKAASPILPDNDIDNARVLNVELVTLDEIAEIDARMSTPVPNDLPPETSISVLLAESFQPVRTTPEKANKRKKLADDTTEEQTPSQDVSLSKRKLRSNVWDHFERRIDSEGTMRDHCRYCQISYQTGSTGNMHFHLKNKHPDKCLLPSGQSKLKALLKPKREVKKEACSNQLVIEDILVTFIVKNCLPFTIVEEKDFRIFLHALNPEFKLMRSGTTVKNRISSTYLEKKMDIIELMKSEGNGKFSATTDLWTFGNHHSIIGVTISWIDQDFELQEIVIGFRKVNGDHTGSDIASVFLNILKEYKIEEKMLCIATDNASSNTSFISEVISMTSEQGSPFKEENHIRCLAHVINLAVQDALIPMKNQLEKIRRLIEAIRSSAKRVEKFKAGLAEENLDLLQLLEEDCEFEEYEFERGAKDLLAIADVTTRWSSCFKLLDRALKIRKGLDLASSGDKNIECLKISPAQWDEIKQMYTFLKPFADATIHVEGFKYPTLSSVIPIYNKLLNYTEDWSRDSTKSEKTKKGAVAAFEKLNSYYDKTTPTYLVATVLDPRHKMNYFIHNGWNLGENGKNLIETYVKPALHAAWADYASLDVVREEEKLQSPSPVSNPEERSDFIDSLFSYSQPPEPDELQSYLSEHVEKRDCHVLSYWKFKSGVWPRLSRMAQDYMAITATSASSERVFSSGRDLLGSARYSLKPETMEAEICLRSWLRSEIVKMNSSAREYYDELETGYLASHSLDAVSKRGSRKGSIGREDIEIEPEVYEYSEY